ncbi:MAG: carbon-nitrogen hydrolase family protein [Saprospiraceae bacterium]
MKIGVAQLKTVKGDIAANITMHQRLLDLAVAAGADALFFPELSITGYEPELAKALATPPEDTRFDCFQHTSNQHNITIGLGMPTLAPTGIHISMLIFQPQQARQTYSKQLLHSDEFPYFVLGNQALILNIGNNKIAPAICYESLQTSHAEQAIELHADLYVASVAKSQKGMEKALQHYPSIAAAYGMPVLMSNCVGYCDNFVSVGGSAVWNRQGHLLAQLDDTQEGILIFDTETEAVMIHNIIF